MNKFLKKKPLSRKGYLVTDGNDTQDFPLFPKAKTMFPLSWILLLDWSCKSKGVSFLMSSVRMWEIGVNPLTDAGNKKMSFCETKEKPTQKRNRRKPPKVWEQLKDSNRYQRHQMITMEDWKTVHCRDPTQDNQRPFLYHS